MVGPFFVKIQNSELALFFVFLTKFEPNTKDHIPRTWPLLNQRVAAFYCPKVPINRRLFFFLWCKNLIIFYHVQLAFPFYFCFFPSPDFRVILYFLSVLFLDDILVELLWILLFFSIFPIICMYVHESLNDS